MSLLDPKLERIWKQDKQFLESTDLPIVTVSASFREDLKGFFGLPENETLPDVVFSRAHYSMTLALLLESWGSTINPQKAWAIDPTNYVSNKQWRSIQLTEFVGKTLARNPLLKAVKDLIDTFGRSKLPILSSITPPLLHLTNKIDKPILSFHIAAGNILADQGKTVIQVITDPHVRDEYVNHADKSSMWYCVFDEKTKIEFLEKAAILGKKADPNRIIVTGPPVDPRVLAARDHKKIWRKGPLKLCITTGGLGTNKVEINTLLQQLLPTLRHHDQDLQLIIYAGTQKDIADMVISLAKQHRVALGKINDNSAKLRLLYHPQIVDANELLIHYGFPWAHGFLTKPSGDMAYDAVAAGCFLLTLQEWGEWEHNIREIFEQKGIARRAESTHIVAQIAALSDTKNRAQSWIESAMNKSISIEKIFLQGTKNIRKVALEVGKKKTP